MYLMHGSLHRLPPFSITTLYRSCCTGYNAFQYIGSTPVPAHHKTYSILHCIYHWSRYSQYAPSMSFLPIHGLHELLEVCLLFLYILPY